MKNICEILPQSPKAKKVNAKFTSLLLSSSAGSRCFCIDTCVFSFKRCCAISPANALNGFPVVRKEKWKADGEMWEMWFRHWLSWLEAEGVLFIPALFIPVRIWGQHKWSCPMFILTAIMWSRLDWAVGRRNDLWSLVWCLGNPCLNPHRAVNITGHYWTIVFS